MKDNLTAPATPVSDTFVAHVRKVLAQLDEGAITAPEFARNVTCAGITGLITDGEGGFDHECDLQDGVE